MKSFPLSWFQSVVAAAVLSLASIGSSSAMAGDEVWVRVHHSGVELRGLSIQSELDDYGSFQWGRVSESEYQALRDQGLSVTASGNPFVLTLGGEQFDPLDSQVMSSKFQPYQADPEGDFHLVQFEGPIRSQWLQDARSAGVIPLQYVHPFSYVLWADEVQLSTFVNSDRVRWSGSFAPEFRALPSQRAHGEALVPTMALVSRYVEEVQVRQDLEALGAVVESFTPLTQHLSVVSMIAPGDRFLDLAHVPALYTVQKVLAEAGPRGEMSNQSIVGNFGPPPGNLLFPGYADWLSETGYDGTGIVVGIVDGGIRTTHQDLVDRIAACVPSGDSPTSCTTSNNTHGTHVAAAVAGTGASGIEDSAGFLRGQGVAPGASVVQQRYSAFLSGFPPCNSPSAPGCMIPDGMLKIFRESALSGAILANNSWGPTGSPQGYDIPTQQIDIITRDATPEIPGNQGVLPVWSIMNGNGDSGGACAPSSLGSPDEAKNLFGVGSTRMQPSAGNQHPNIFDVSANSAHGPTCDGRTGLHIVAPGCSTDSASGGGDSSYTLLCGTSMASPVASGAVAIFAEYFQDMFGDLPSPAMMKAAVTAVATNLHGFNNADGGTITETPSRFQGYGRLDLDAVVNSPYEVIYFDQEHVFTQTGQEWSTAVVADDPNEPIRLMLMWTDAHGHGLGGTTPAWVNDLDLLVQANGTSFLGNVIGSDGFSTSGGARDDRNNAEAVFLRSDQHSGGLVEVTIEAANIAADALDPHDPGDPRQDFALVCYNCVISEGGFSLALDPVETSVCIPDEETVNLLVNVSVEAPVDFTGTVDLSAEGLPAGVASSFDPASVEGAGSSEWTLTIDASAEAGSTNLMVIGDDGDATQQQEFSLTLLMPPDAPLLQAPGDGETGVDLQPTLSWDALIDVDDYSLQLATDSGFENLIVDTVVSGSSFGIEDSLNDGTAYYWRVRGQDQCGDGQWSEVFEFQTRFDPQADVTPTALEAEVITGQSGQLILNILNEGSGQLDWEIANVACGDEEGTDWLSAAPASGSVSSGNTDVVTVTLDAADLEPGTYAGELCITTNVFGGSPIPVVVDLEVLELPPAQAEIDISILQFGSVPTNLSPTRTLEIRNASEGVAADLSIDIIAVIAGGSVFELVGHDCPNALPASQSCTVEVSFAPDAVRAYSGVLRITIDGESRNINLSGTGVEPDPNIFQDRFEDEG